MSLLKERISFHKFEEILSDDEKKLILNFLDISSLCNVNCVSKRFSLSQLSNDDLFWKEHFQTIITEYYLPSNKHSYQYIYYNQQETKDIKKQITNVLQSTTKDYKNEIIKFFKQIIENVQKVQKDRLSKIKFKNDAILLNKQTLLQKGLEIMKEFTPKEPWDCKMVTVGDGAVGKTCMIMVLGENIPNIKNVEYIPTVMENYNITVSFKKRFNVNLWDTAGQDEYERIRFLSYPNSDILLLCFSVDRESSFENIEGKWFQEIQSYCPRTPIVLCGTKIDLRENKKVLFNSMKNKRNSVPISKEEGEALAKRIGAIAYIETSSFEPKGFDDLAEFILLLSKVRKHYKLEKEEELIKKNCFIQ